MGGGDISGGGTITGTFVGGITGNVTGNADTATALATARAINGVDFDGSAAITVTADANTLSNTTLKSTVVTSSLTSVGTIGTGVWNGTAIASAYLDADTAHLSGSAFTGNVSVVNGVGGTAGVVTINNSSSDGLLELQRTTGSPSVEYVIGADSTRLYIRNNTDSNDIMTWLEGGNVGIGTTSPASPLHIYENTTATDSSAGLTIEQAGTGDAILQFLETGTQRWVMGLDNSDGDKFKISSDGDLNTNARLTIDTSGNATFAGELDVNPGTNKRIQFTFPTDEYTNESRIGFSDLNAYITYKANPNHMEIWSYNSLYLQTGSSPTTALTIDSSQNATFAGQVGIGQAPNTNVSNKSLQIKSTGTDAYTDTSFNDNCQIRLTADSVDNNYVAIGFNHQGQSEYFIGIKRTNASNAGLVDFMWQGFNGSSYVEFARLNSSGNMTISGSYASSDETLKKNINTINGGLDKINALRGVTYKWNEKSICLDKDSLQYGLVAQEVEKVVPEIVLEDPEKGLKAIEYSKITAILVEAIKELTTRLEALENA
jgi:hypothetical protein